ncbi:hypothetical protein [Flavobacterium sp. 7A]|uniref:hypothetical protein n=1 Tax=Flavobacterium sp. 7A TaxID=2940571 RepID=UPI00222747C2|nr:hypothetical protein [Flavobacterium sp. 7A]MCW2118068.1 hypothetical protein [Flavobacterium sp. 7A]
MKNLKHFIVTLFITLILLFKVAGLHALSHESNDTDIEHCQICDIVTAANFTPLLQTKAIDFPQFESFPSVKEQTTNTVYVVYNNQHLDNFLFTRPPPQFL